MPSPPFDELRDRRVAARDEPPPRDWSPPFDRLRDRRSHTDGVGRIAIAAYTHAKTATEVLAFELDRRLRGANSGVQSLVVRPGVGVDAKTPERVGVRDATTPFQRNYLSPLAQGKNTAAWSAVRAMLDPTLDGGDYVGPSGALRGLPVVVEQNAHTATPAGDRATRLWEQTERHAGVALARPTGPL
jgi:hypothetical protein